ncbi:response regulator [Methylobacter sp.]|jgi:CheY-like chemotaxis protein|uniref:response regulator n=1 Tax=Methylobacter sp. TaxID=2051955 RepID=UPI003DA55EDF
MNSIQPILLVEDDQVDIMTVKRGLKKLGVVNKLITVNNGEEALHYLENSEDVLPCMILLDINMPKMNGHECLKQLKNHPAFKNIPVVMLTSSLEQQDVNQSFELGISGYILKPVEYDQFIDAIQVLRSYWTINK